jgi:hypothetical protein
MLRADLEAIHWLDYCSSSAVLRGTAVEMRMFGRTGLELSVLGFGCVRSAG